MSKVTYDDMFNLLEEIDIGARDKTRTINSISNSTVRDMVRQESSMAIRAGATAAILASGTAISGALIGSIGGVGLGAVSTGVTSLGLGAVSAFAGAATGAAAGSPVPIIGTVIGAGIGLAVGVFAGKRKQQKQNEQKERLKQEVISKQNRQIRDLENELNELKEKYRDAVEKNERYRYIVGILMANEELKKAA